MGSIVTIHRPRMTKAEYKALKSSFTYNSLKELYINNCNDFICKQFNINLSTLYKLLKDFEIILTEEEKSCKIKMSTEQKNLEYFGTTTPSVLPEIKERIRKTNMERYGVENVFAATEIKEKIKATTLERYGVEYIAQSNEIKQKIKDTCLKRYGVDNYAKTVECVEKIKTTNLNKYGVEYTQQVPEIRKKGIQTCFIKYGMSTASSLPEVRAKTIATNLNRYGATHYSKTYEFHTRLRKQYTYNDTSFDSLPELAVWLYCIDNNVPIQRNPCFFEYEYDGAIHSYFPDFEINGQLVEIKGDHFFKADGTMRNPFDSTQDELYEAKHQCGIEHGVQFWKKVDYKKYLEYFNANYELEDCIFKKKEAS